MQRTYSMDEHKKLPLNDTLLDVRIRGTNVKNPVVLFLHGGPGVCDRHFVLKDQAPLTDVCTLVCLDQRGSGRSYTAAQAKLPMNMETVIEDARLLLDSLRERFQQDKIIVVGHSYGSFLGVLLAQRYPEKIASYVGIGQVANGAENERISYEFVWNEAQKRNDLKAIRELTRIGAPKNGLYASLDDLTVQRNLMTKYGGAAHGHKENMITSIALPVLFSPEYGISGLVPYAKGAYYNLRSLWREVIACDFTESVRKLDVPVFLTIGRHDSNTPPEISKSWFDALDAPKKEWFWFENSAHSPIREESARWNEVFRSEVLGVK